MQVQNNKQKKFSIVQYQEKLIEELKKEYKNENYVSWIFIEDKNKKIWKINTLEIEFIEEVKFNTLLPPFKEALLSVANIQEKEILLIDLNVYLYKEKSIFRLNESKKDELIKKYKCLLLKNKKIGLLVQILPSYENNNNIEELDIKKILNYINIENDI